MALPPLRSFLSAIVGFHNYPPVNISRWHRQGERGFREIISNLGLIVLLSDSPLGAGTYGHA
jgi:hypothetical protein